MISVYQDNGYFARRIEDPQCRGLDYYDANLVPAAHGDGASRSGLALKHVVQSQVRILVPILQGTNLVFVSRRPTNLSSQDSNSGSPVQETTFLI